MSARLQLVESSLRHGQQALLVSRLRQQHAIDVAGHLDSVGFSALDVFGGTTFEAQLRFLAENPFERLRMLKAQAPMSMLMATLGGQALVGHRHVADDVVDLFIRVCADLGVDIFRCYDPLNDVRNLQRCVTAVVAAGKQAQGVIVYTDVESTARHRDTVDMAKKLVSMGCTSLCLYDPLGVLRAASAHALIAALTKAVDVPIAVSIAAQTGQADLTYAAAIRAGAQCVDVALSPLSGGMSMPAAESIVASYEGTATATGLSIDAMAEAARTLEGVLSEYAHIIDPLAWRIDTAALRGMLPVSAMGHALVALRERNALDRLGDVELEIVRIRGELGSPPMVTPIAEIVATQAVYNVCDGDRYATISQEVKDYCLGLYGSPPLPIDAGICRSVNGKEEPITLRPADLLDPMVPALRAELEREGFPDASDETVAGYALFPTEFLAVLRGDAKSENLNGVVASEDTAIVASPNGTVIAEAQPALATPSVSGVRDLTVEVDGETYSVRVHGLGAGGGGNGGGTVGEVVMGQAKPVIKDGTVVAPMQGLLLKVNVSAGDVVQLGDVVAVLEAMKMQNDITATKAGAVTEIFVKEGAVVGPREPILQIG